MLKFLSIGIVIAFIALIYIFRKNLNPFFRFVTSKLFIINLVLAGLALFLIPYFTLQYLNDYTNHGVKIAVPNFIGSSIEDVSALANDKQLKIIISDSVFSDDFPKGTVLRQNPKPNSENYPSYVKPNRKIYLTIVKQGGEYKEIPDLTGDYRVSKKIAKVRLEMLGFKTSFTAVPSPDDYVIKLKYKGKEVGKGDKVLKGETIEIVHGNGGGGKPVILENVEGLTVYDATQKLSLAGLNVDVNYEGENISAEDSINFVVRIQNPHPRNLPQQMVQTGTTVTLIAEKGTPIVKDSTQITPSITP